MFALECEKCYNKMEKLLEIAQDNGYSWSCCDMDYEYFSNGYKEIAVDRKDIELGNFDKIAW